MFSWVDFNKELSDILLSYEDKQSELISILKKSDINVPVLKKFIDPFTFISLLYKYGNKKCVEKNKKLSKILEMKSILSDSDGIPRIPAHNILFSKDKISCDKIWIAFKQMRKDKKIDNSLFKEILNFQNVSYSKLTIAMYCLDPENFMCLDDTTNSFLKEKYEMDLSGKDFLSFDNYYEIMNKIKELDNRNFYEISNDAWNKKSENKNKLKEKKYIDNDILYQVIKDIYTSKVYNKSALDFRILAFNQKFKELITRYKTIGERVRNLKEIYRLIKSYIGVSDIEKKLKGEVFTPFELIEEMLNTLPKEFWENKEQKILEPANGVGNFVAVLVQRFMYGFKHPDGWETKGLSETIENEEDRYKWVLENMIYACDIQPKNMFIYLLIFDPKGVYKMNYFTGDFLSDEFDGKLREWNIENFDLITSNPPYHKPNNNESDSKTTQNVKLWREFLEISFNYIKKDKYLLFLTPSSWASGSKNPHNKTILLKDIFLKKNTIYVSFDANHYFKKIGVDFSYYLIQNKKYEKNTLIETDESKTIINLENFSILPKILNKNIFSFLEKINVEKFNFVMDRKDHYKKSLYKNKNMVFNIPVYCGVSKGILYSDKSSPFYKKSKIFTHRISTLKMISDQNGDISTNYSQVYLIKDGENAQFASSLFDTKFYKFIINIFKYTQYNECSVLNQTPKIDLSKSWSDENLYKYFNLTEEEIKLIEDTIK